MTSDRFVLLQLAQAFVSARGDEAWFHHVYTGAREHHDIRDSVYCALRAQDLIQAFDSQQQPDLG